MNRGDLYPVAQFDLVSVLKTLGYAILVPNGLIIGYVGLVNVLYTPEIFGPYVIRPLVGLLEFGAAILGGLTGAAIVGWITARRYGNRTPLLLIVPCGLFIPPIYYFRLWELILVPGVVAITLISALVFGAIGAIGTLIGVFANYIDETVPQFYAGSDGSQ